MEENIKKLIESSNEVIQNVSLLGVPQESLDGWKQQNTEVITGAYQAGIRRAVEKIHGTKVTTGNAEAQFGADALKRHLLTALDAELHGKH